MQDILVITDWTIPVNQPDIVLHNKREKTCLLIDIDKPDDSNINKKETAKLSNYKDLEMDIAGCGKWGQELCQLHMEH